MTFSSFNNLLEAKCVVSVSFLRNIRAYVTYIRARTDNCFSLEFIGARHGKQNGKGNTVVIY